MKVQCQIWVGRISLLSSENSSLHLFGEVYLHVCIKQSNLNSSYEINISLMQVLQCNLGMLFLSAKE